MLGPAAVRANVTAGVRPLRVVPHPRLPPHLLGRVAATTTRLPLTVRCRVRPSTTVGAPRWRPLMLLPLLLLLSTATVTLLLSLTAVLRRRA